MRGDKRRTIGQERVLDESIFVSLARTERWPTRARKSDREESCGVKMSKIRRRTTKTINELYLEKSEREERREIGKKWPKCWRNLRGRGDKRVAGASKTNF